MALIRMRRRWKDIICFEVVDSDNIVCEYKVNSGIGDGDQISPLHEE